MRRTKPKVLSVEEVSRILDQAYATTLQQAKDGRLPCLRLGRRFLILKDEFEKMLKGPTERPAA